MTVVCAHIYAWPGMLAHGLLNPTAQRAGRAIE